MTQAECADTAPRPCTSIPSRRSVLGGLATAALAGAAVLPVPAVAIVDPIFAAIERHREASERYSAAVEASAILASDDANFDPAAALTDETTDALIAIANDLIRTEPTTLAGVVALARHLAGLEEWEEPIVDRAAFDEANGARWRRVAMTTIASAVAKIQSAGVLS